MKDLFGKALQDYQNGNYTEDLITSTNISDKDKLPLPYLFRGYNDMPKLEQKALQLCQGYVLDAGCGAGSHSLWLQKCGLHIKAIDVSKGAIEVAKSRGVLNTEQKALLAESETFDTILLLMNGTGIFQKLDQVSDYLKHLKSLLKTDGQILIDSSDICYMYDFEDEDEDEDEVEHEDEVEKLNQLNNGNYYGELDYYLSYKGENEYPMKWLYLDFKTLSKACQSIGLKCEKVMDGEHFDFLAKIYV
ncbi:methyltransferase domain-containing protein [uncultured Winogradskyella sp.]|uniref:class I SAM-dependent methyltransferase n=1 Tax=uncultured Winogradskyella sp. TaxID=395353 RepID=UPI002618C81E|nr:methyltransferase domain-containing protein [uncultured Winogradskyella sp.]